MKRCNLNPRRCPKCCMPLMNSDASSAGIGWSHASPRVRKRCIYILHLIVIGANHPIGSNTLATWDNISRLVTGVVISGRQRSNLKWSVLYSQVIPSVLIVELSSRLTVSLPPNSSGKLSISFGWFETLLRSCILAPSRVLISLSCNSLSSNQAVEAGKEVIYVEIVGQRLGYSFVSWFCSFS